MCGPPIGLTGPFGVGLTPAHRRPTTLGLSPLLVCAQELLAQDFGVADQWPVFAEHFTQWVIEDHFARHGPRPLLRCRLNPAHMIMPCGGQ